MSKYVRVNVAHLELSRWVMAGKVVSVCVSTLELPKEVIVCRALRVNLFLWKISDSNTINKGFSVNIFYKLSIHT